MKQPKVWAFVQIGKLEGQIWSTGIFDDTCAHEFVKVGAGKSSRLLIGLPCLRVRRFQGCVECQPTRPASGWNTGKKTTRVCCVIAWPILTVSGPQNSWSADLGRLGIQPPTT